MDRLTKSEIYEVIRLIRNTANFPYLKFIVACDRKYIIEQLKELNMNPKYLEIDNVYYKDLFENKRNCSAQE